VGKRQAYQLSTAQMKLQVRMNCARIHCLSRAIIPSATSLIRLTSSLSKLLWPEALDREVRLASKSKVLMTGDAGRELGAMVYRIQRNWGSPMAVEGAPWACPVLLAYREFKPGSRLISMNAQDVASRR